MPAAVSRTSMPRQDKRPLVLVADDDVVTTQIIEGALAQIGFRACTAHDGEAAMQRIREHLPDLILLDILAARRERNRTMPKAADGVRSVADPGHLHLRP